MKTLEKDPIRFGKYLLLDRISIGGMAEVWRAAETEGAGRTVAIKRLLPTVAEHSELVSMFIAEGKIMLQLTHPNIARVYELGEVAGSHFISMEYVPGKDLRKILDRCRKSSEPAPIAVTCHVISQLCSALDYAHRWRDESGRPTDLVHRDVSPSNVLVGFAGEVKLIDFGIAKQDDGGRSDRSVPSGKLAYMSPEQARGVPLDRRSDLFSVGICLYEMLTGGRPFSSDSHPALGSGVDFQIPSPVTANANIPPTLEAIVLKALASDARARYQEANELAADLSRFLTESGNFEAKDLVAYMQSIFAEDIEREQPQPAEGAAPMRSLLPKVAAVGPLLGNAVSADGEETAPESNATVDPSQQAVATDPATGRPSERPPTRNWSAQNRVSDAVRASVRAFSEPAPPSNPDSTAMAPPSEAGSTAVSATPEPASKAHEPTPEPSPALSKGKALGWGMLGAALVSAVALGAFLVAREVDSGFVAIELPLDLKGKKVEVVFRGEPLPVPEQGRLVHKARAGSGLLTIQAQGFQPFSQNVEVKGGRETTEVAANLAPVVSNAQLAVLVEPEDAEVRLNGSLVASGGAPFYLADIPVGVERLVQVGHAGYRSYESRVKASRAGEQVKVHAKLQPLEYLFEVESSPVGAMVWANGARLGRTPVEVRLFADTKELTLTRRCYQPALVPVAAKAEGDDPVAINVSLKRLPSCR